MLLDSRLCGAVLMIENEIEHLVLETLSGNRRGPAGSCIKVNEAGIELSQLNGEALKVIEDVIAKYITPLLPCDAQTNLDDDMIFTKYSGIKYVLGAYLLIGVRTRDNRIFHFLDRQHPWLVARALYCICIFFHKNVDEYNFGVSPNEQILEYSKGLTTSNNPEIAEAARYVLDVLKKQEVGTNDNSEIR
ncbi:MAG: hypothetical protein ACKVT0_04045 [Planctomycetaceae bacterium]